MYLLVCLRSLATMDAKFPKHPQMLASAGDTWGKKDQGWVCQEVKPAWGRKGGPRLRIL